MNDLPHVLGLGNAGAGLKFENSGNASCGSALGTFPVSNVFAGVVECVIGYGFA